jgi:ribosome biogenesis protein Nip4
MNKLISFVKELTKAEVKELNSSERIGRKYFYMSKELKELKDSISLEPYSVGIFLGELKNNQFMPSIALLDILAKYSDRKIIINKKGQTMFLYGNDVFFENIKENNLSDGICLVLNEENEVLGYGELKKGRKKILKHILDRGDFLRRERD